MEESLQVSVRGAPELFFDLRTQRALCQLELARVHEAVPWVDRDPDAAAAARWHARRCASALAEAEKLAGMLRQQDYKKGEVEMEISVSQRCVRQAEGLVEGIPSR